MKEIPRGTLHKSIDLGDLELVLYRAYDENTQDEWIKHWNKLYDLRYFASMPDLYKAFKEVKQEQRDYLRQALIASYSKYDKPMIITSTRIRHSPLSLDAEITHNIGSEREKRKRTEVPVYSSEGIIKVLEEPKGLKFLQALFDTEDNAKTILDVFMNIFVKYQHCKISISTMPAIDGKRAMELERVVGFRYDRRECDVLAECYLKAEGQTFPVVEKPGHLKL